MKDVPNASNSRADDLPFPTTQSAITDQPHLAASRVAPLSQTYKIALIGFTILAAGYLLLGLVTLVWDTEISYPVDLRLRWIEQNMVYRGINPQDHTYPAELLPDNVQAQRFLKGSYPPWSYATSVILAPPGPWRAVRVYFAAVSVLAVAFIAIWVVGVADRAAPGWGPLAAAGTLALFPICVCLSYGQYSLIVLALLVGALLCLQNGRYAAAGVAAGMAAVKPQLAGLFFLAPAIYPLPWLGKARFFIASTAYLVLSSIGIALFVDGSALDMLRATGSESAKFVHLSNNPLVVWASNALGFSLGSKLLAASVAFVCALLLAFIRRSQDLLSAFGVCAILAFYWSYSRHYDLVLLILPMTQLFLMWRRDKSQLAGLAMLLMAMLLWLPIRIDASRLPAVQFMIAAICALALGAMVSGAVKHRVNGRSTHWSRSKFSKAEST